ncbi:hypothetical protein BJ138DRAFT_976455, partial [Hygrophoropsis aurantiaca]
PATPSLSSDDQMRQMAAAFQNMSPNSQNKMSALFTLPSKAPTPKIVSQTFSPSPRGLLFTLDQEQPALTGLTDFAYGIHAKILDLADTRGHLPLTLFTTTSTQLIFLDPGTLKHVTFYPSDGGLKKHVLDVSQFPLERNMSITEHNKGWARWKRFMRENYEEAIILRWEAHHNFLCSVPGFEANFQVILTFDIEERTAYALER